METDKGSLLSVLTDNGASASSDRTVNRVSQIINGKRAVTGDRALRFGHWFGVEPEFWLNLRNQFDLVRTNQ